MRIALNRTIATLAFALSLSATAALAQQAKMYGSVVDDQGQPVVGAKVVLNPTEQGSHLEVVTKGKKASFLFGIVRAGTYTIDVQAPGLVLVSMDAKATTKDKKEPEWTKNGKVRTDQPPQLKIEDGMEITCDLVVGHAAQVATAGGGTTMATPDQALTMLTQQVQKGDCAGALPQLEKFATDNPTSGRAYYLAGYCDAVMEKDDAALVALTKAQELEPAFAGTQTLIGKIYARTNRLPEAETAFKKELENTSAPAEVQTDALLSLGAVQRDQKKDQDAIASFEKVKTLAPTRPESYIELSALYAKVGQTDKAAAVLEEAKQVGADDPVALLNVGISYYNKKDFEHAEQMFKRVTESKATNPDLSMAYGLLGNLQLRKGKTDDAVAAFKKCIELDPNGKLAKESEETLKALKKK
ncbi:MAG TPA: tetratricopeptide repeat protein [Candidatus Polarisedimenticolaceae bacterium]|nr:tetratricopeptide repeat protein [Candidatus Polarisedimenticolaceae bacterium]